MNQWVHKFKTTLINVLGGTTNRKPPSDVSINKSFKNYVRELFEQHLDANLEPHIEGNLTAKERHVLSTKWVAEAGICEEKT